MAEDLNKHFTHHREKNKWTISTYKGAQHPWLSGKHKLKPQRDILLFPLQRLKF